MKSTSTRCALLDELRGLDLISMMLYHGMWDLVYLFGVRVPVSFSDDERCLFFFNC